MSTLALTLLVLIIGNVSILLELNFENKLIYYSALIYLVSNWLGLHDLILANYSFSQLFNKLSFDFIILLLFCLILPLSPNLSEFRVYFTLAIFSYPIFIFVYFLKKNEKYAFSFYFVLLLHLINLTIIFSDPDYYLIILTYVVCYCFVLYAMLNLYSLNYSETSDKSKKLDKEDWVLYFKIFITTVLFGEIDRYFLAYFIDAKTAILYVTLASILGFIPLISASLMQYLVNKRKIHNETFNFDRKLKILFYVTNIVGVVITFILGYEPISIILLSTSLFFKYYFVINTMKYIVDFYYLKKIKLIYKLNLNQNLIGLVINFLYFFIPAAVFITALSKLISTYPLVKLDREMGNKN